MQLQLYVLLHIGNDITGISFLDSTHLSVCHNKRIHQNKVFRGLAARGKTTIGWFYGFKLYHFNDVISQIRAIA